MRPMSDHIDILYNGQCPICRAEITRYRAMSARAGAPLSFHDLSEAPLERWQLDADAAARRLHARMPDGRLLSGVPAFAEIWARLPGLRWLARAVRWPLVGRLARFGYDRLAAPFLYRLHLRRQRRAGPAGNAVASRSGRT